MTGYPPQTDLSFETGEQELEMGSMTEFHQKMEKDAEAQKPLVTIVAKLLSKLVDNNDKFPSDKEITVFHAQKAPAVNVIDYAESIMVAAKFLDDFYYSNEFWAKIGGVPNAELNTLELEFLFLTNFDLHVKRQVYDRYREALLDWQRAAASTTISAAAAAGALTAEMDARVRSWPPGCLWEAVLCPPPGASAAAQHLLIKGMGSLDEGRMDMDRDGAAAEDAMAVDS